MLNEKLSRRNFLKLAAALAATLGLPWPEVAEAEANPVVPADLEQLEEYLADEARPPSPEVEALDWKRPAQSTQTSRILGQGGLLEIDSEQAELLSFVLAIDNDFLGNLESTLTFSYLSHDVNGRRLPDLFFGPIGRNFHQVTLDIPNGPTLQAQGIFHEIGIPYAHEGGPVIISGEILLFDCVLTD